jgi:hypothetical protein
MNPVKRISSPPNGRVAAMGEAIQERIAHVPEQITEVVDERPLAAVLCAFGMGLAAGVGLVALYCQMQHQQTVQESLMQKLTDAVRSALPAQLSSMR